LSQREQYLDLPLEEVIGDRFGRYSKYIIQDRALPDARDGLKPVQRRILYAMHKEGNTHEKGFRKSAKTVGTVIGNYHPHGDSSVYEAMVRLSQDWKVRNVLVEMHGNNGSVDGDPPAAMRYTEARLAPIAGELLRDIDKETVEFIPNFDDTNHEPVVLPARFPNLLVNGSTGISAGYATDIPPHNLNEVIDAVIKKIDSPDVTIDELIELIPGPDFPTGGIIQGADGIKQAYRTGKGKVVVRGRCEIETLRSKREQIVITEIPYEVNKANLVKRMDELKLDRKVEGVAEIRDETDRTGMRIVIELKKEADSEGILNFFYKNTDLQITYNFNMVAIVDKTPKLMSLVDMLEAYIKHQRHVIRRAATFDLNKAKTRHHIVEGLIKAISVLDELIQKIRQSKDKKDAKTRIKEAYQFTEEQAEAIVNLQLYRLTNTDITALQQELDALTKEMARLEKIVTDDKTLDNVIKKDLKDLKKRFNTVRLTTIEQEVEELKINLEVMIASEDVLVSVTHDGYIKRTSLRSYQASNGEDLAMKEEDRLVGLYEVNTTDTMLMFTNRGKYIYAPVHTLPDIRWKDLAQHASHLVGLDQGEKIIEAMPMRDFNTSEYLIFFTKNGMVKRSELKQYEASRYSKPLIATGLKKGDEVISVHRSNGLQDVFVVSNRGYGLRYNEAEISPVGQRAAGVKAIQLKQDEHVASGLVMSGEDDDTFFTLVTQRGAMKRMALSLFETAKRANRGQIMLRELKGKPHRVVGFLECNSLEQIVLETTSGDRSLHHPMALSLSDRYSNGSFVLDTDQVGDVVSVYKETLYEAPFKEDK
jgi:topoisomerase-4 subunit A